MSGYAKLGLFMAHAPELAIFRRFGALNVQSLLYLQAELHHLEKELREYAQEDEASGHPERLHYSKDWRILKTSVELPEEEGHDPRQWLVMREIQEKLRNYSRSFPATFHSLVTTY